MIFKEKLSNKQYGMCQKGCERLKHVGRLCLSGSRVGPGLLNRLNPLSYSLVFELFLL